MVLKKCKECGKVGGLTILLAIIGFFIIIGILSSLFKTETHTHKDVPITSMEESGKEKEAIVEVRICPRDGINIRTGPGTDYENDETGQLVKGEKLYILEEKNGWIRFRVTPKDVGWSGWVKKDLTVLESQWISTKEGDAIKTLRESGLLTKINPQLNEAYVDPAIWNGIDYQTKENIGRIMAFYCGRKKGTNLNWVDIKDSYSGKNLAKYSENWGFKVY